MIKSQKNKYYAFWAVTILLFLFYLLDRSKVEERINSYKSDIALIEKELIINDVLIENINDSRNYFESIMDTIESQNISDNQFKYEINRMKQIAKELNVSISQLEIDPKNSFPGKFQISSKIDTKLKRQIISLNLRGHFLDIGKFLESYEKINAPLKFQSCAISLDSLDPKGVIARLYFSMYTGIKS